MKKLLKSLIALFMCAVTFFGVTACGNDDEENATELTLFGWSLTSVNAAKKTNSPLYAKIKEHSNVDLKVNSVDSGVYDDALNKLFNAGELTDLFITYGPERAKQYKKMIDNETLLAVSDYVSETKYPNLYKHLKKFDFLKDIYYSNGKHWSIPTLHTNEHSLYVRMDWIENLNKTSKLTQILTEELGHVPSEAELEQYKFKEPTTILEFYRLAKAFTKYDPDENGLNDTYGYSGTSDLWSENWIYIAFSGGYQNMIKGADGKYTSSTITDGTKQAIAFLNRLHQERIMHPDWQTDTFDDKQVKFNQGKVGIIEAHNWFNNIIIGFRAVNPSYSIEEASKVIKMINPPAGPNGDYGISGHPGFWTVVCLNADMSEAKREKALALMDYLYSEEGQNLFVYGIENVHYKVEGGEKVSIMGKNSSGYNYTVASYDAAYPLSEFCNWVADYYSPYATNADKIVPQMQKSAQYAVYEEKPFLQTPLYVENFQSMEDYAEECFVGFITGSEYYGNYSNGMPTWDNIVNVNSNFQSAWNAFKTKYLGDYKGSETIAEYNQYANK